MHISVNRLAELRGITTTSIPTSVTRKVRNEASVKCAFRLLRPFLDEPPYLSVSDQARASFPATGGGQAHASTLDVLEITGDKHR